MLGAPGEAHVLFNAEEGFAQSRNVNDVVEAGFNFRRKEDLDRPNAFDGAPSGTIAQGNERNRARVGTDVVEEVFCVYHVAVRPAVHH